jgi:hypothetical protein
MLYLEESFQDLRIPLPTPLTLLETPAEVWTERKADGDWKSVCASLLNSRGGRCEERASMGWLERWRRLDGLILEVVRSYLHPGFLVHTVVFCNFSVSLHFER